MSFKRNQIISVGMLSLVLVLTFFVSGTPITNTTLVRKFPQSKIGSAGSLLVLETINPTPVRMNYSFVSNTTISLFVQTKSQYENSDTGNTAEDYLATFSDDEGSFGYEPEDYSKRHVISIYSEENFYVRDIILETEYQSTIQPTGSLTLNLIRLFTLGALGLQGYRMYLEKED